MLKKLIDFFYGTSESAASFAGKRILVIDDGEVERRFISRALEKKGYVVSVAAEGRTGIKLAQEEQPDLIVLDYRMPGLNGIEVCKRLKSRDEQTCGIPVIFLTGSTTPADVIDCYEVGAEYYLSKPISARTLTNEVEMVFKDQGRLASSRHNSD